MVVAITEKSRVGDHKGGVATTPKAEVIAPAHAGHQLKAAVPSTGKLVLALKAAKALLSRARAQVGYEAIKFPWLGRPRPRKGGYRWLRGSSL